jgi:hypothetical protein
MAGGDVIDLPVGLASWATQLSVLPGDLALTLAPWVGRLALAVGPLRSVHTQNSGEPDGYSGLSRRGSYERLVTAEWGIAELFPDEFLRRAASGEHLFLDLARREPHGALRSIAIVSAGPAQLGAPRLAHLAALIVLARRAAGAGAGFSWGVLEDPEHRLTDGLDEAGIQRLLGARTATPASADALQGWSNAIGGDAGTDFWFIGANEDAANAAHVRASRIIVRDLLEPGTRALELDIDRRGPSARLRLDLPAPEQCARLLRDPFARGASTPRVAPARGPAHEVRFAPGGRRLIVRLANGSFESWPIPSSPRDKLGSPRTWTPPANHVVLSVGIGKRSILAVTAKRDDPTCLELSYGHNPRVGIKFVAEAFPSEVAQRVDEGAPLPLGTCAFVRLRDEKPDLVVEILGRLFFFPGLKLWPKPGTVTQALSFNSGVSQVPAPVAGTAFFKTSLVWAQQQENGQLYITEVTASGNKKVVALTTREEPVVHFGFAMPPSETWGVATVAKDTENWSVAAPALDTTTINTVVPVVGVCLRDGVPALLTRPHPYRLAWVTTDSRKMFRRELLPTATAPIVAVAVCPAQPNIAWLTETGEVVVYSMQHKAVLFRRVPGDAQ